MIKFKFSLLLSNLKLNLNYCLRLSSAEHTCKIITFIHFLDYYEATTVSKYFNEFFNQSVAVTIMAFLSNDALQGTLN